MLKGLDPILNADLLYALKAMGHGDEMVVVDANFPATSVASTTVMGEVIRLDGVNSPRAVEAILSVLPLDTFVDHAVHRMEVVGEPHRLEPVAQEVQAVINKAEGKACLMGAVERFAFYERARASFCVVQCSEPRFYCCFLIRKGVIAPQ